MIGSDIKTHGCCKISNGVRTAHLPARKGRAVVQLNRWVSVAVESHGSEGLRDVEKADMPSYELAGAERERERERERQMADALHVCRYAGVVNLIVLSL